MPSRHEKRSRIASRRIALVFKVASPALLVCLLLLALAAADFASRLRPTFRPEAEPGAAVVFTGQLPRTRAGLKLLATGQVRRLLVSGVNPRAGMPAARFATQFQLSPALIQTLDDGQLSLGQRADNTLENALETRCWAKSLPAHAALMLITSSWHLPRASVALESALPGHRIERYAVEEGTMSRKQIAHEFLGYLATRVIGLWWRLAGRPDFPC